MKITIAEVICLPNEKESMRNEWLQPVEGGFLPSSYRVTVQHVGIGLSTGISQNANNTPYSIRQQVGQISIPWDNTDNQSDNS